MKNHLSLEAHAHGELVSWGDIRMWFFLRVHHLPILRDCNSISTLCIGYTTQALKMLFLILQTLVAEVMVLFGALCYGIGSLVTCF